MIIDPTFCGSRFSTGRLLAIEDFSEVKISLSNNCAVIIIGVYRPSDKSKIPEFRIKLIEILSSTSQSEDVFIVGDLNINLLDPTAI